MYLGRKFGENSKIIGKNWNLCFVGFDEIQIHICDEIDAKKTSMVRIFSETN